MAFDKRAYRYVFFIVLSIFLCSCAFFSSRVKVEEKDFLSVAQKHVTQLKADYVLMTGLFDVSKQKMDELIYVPFGMKLTRMKWKAFHADLANCWNAPFEIVENAQQRDLNATNIARHFSNQTPRRELQIVQDAVANAVNKHKECPQALADDVQGVGRRTPEEVKAWARDRMILVNDLRVLVRKAVPARVTGYQELLDSASPKIQAIINDAEKHSEDLKQGGTDEQQSNHQAQLLKIRQLADEVSRIRSDVEASSSTISEEVSTFVGQIEDSLKQLGRK